MTPKVAALLFVTLALLAAALHPGVVDNVDSRIILRTAEQLVDAHTWSLGDVAGTYMANAEYGGVGPDGSHQMKFGPGTALLDVPFVLLGRATLGPLGLDAHRAGEAAAAFASVLWYAASAVLVLRIARRVASERVALGAALVHAVASYALVYGRSAYLETPLTVFTLLAFDAALAARARPADPRPALALGAAVAAILWIKVAAVLLVVGVVPILFLGRDGFRRDALRACITAAVPFAVGVAGLLTLNWVRFGSPFETGYAGSARFDNPLFGGLIELLASERGGLLFCAPLALVGVAGLPALARLDRGLAWGIGLAFAAVLPLYATFFSPFGGDAWGPRYLVPNVALLAVPAALVLATALRAGGARRALAAAAIAAGCALQVPPALVSFTEFWTVVRRIDIESPLRPGRATARMLAARAAGAPTVSIWAVLPPPAQRGLPEFPFPTPSLDLWPVRVAKDLPRHATFAWAAWGVVVAATLGCGATLALRNRRLPT